MRNVDATSSSSDNPLVGSYRIILLGQALAVIAAITGFIGLTLAYKTLIRDQSPSKVRIVEPPTIE